jgi:hypothetical protein
VKEGSGRVRGIELYSDGREGSADIKCKSESIFEEFGSNFIHFEQWANYV